MKPWIARVVGCGVLVTLGCASNRYAHIKTEDIDSLCELQQQVERGDSRLVRVAGWYSYGFESSTLTPFSCATKETTSISFEMNDERSGFNKLHKKARKNGRVLALVEGEFFGPPMPDPDLSEWLQEEFPPGWGHLSCCKTKLVVHRILDMKVP